MKKLISVIFLIIIVLLSFFLIQRIASFINYYRSDFNIDKTSLNQFISQNTTTGTNDPEIKVTTVISNLDHPWEVAFIDNDSFYYTQRSGRLRFHILSTKEDMLVTQPSDVSVRGEGGLLGLAVDNKFQTNHYIYTCMSTLKTNPVSIVVTRWEINPDLKSIKERKDIITGIPSNISERHSGCRVKVDATGNIWVGTGDTATGTVPQDPKSLGGKVLRVNKDGQAVEGNLGDSFDSRIFSYGHRNIQGIYLFDKPLNGIYGLTAEHGPNKNDEVNLLKEGNFGWDPIPGYNESVPMTDLTKFPDAIQDIWNSGDPTIAISGMTQLKGNIWKGWKDAVLVAVLKDKHVRLQKYDSNWKLVSEQKILDGYGRVRTVVQAPNGDLFFSTDNGKNQDIIARVSPN